MSPGQVWPQRVAILGVGTMGHGIAQQFAAHGRQVACWDENETALAAAPAAIGRNLEIALEMGAIDPTHAEGVRANVRCAVGLADAVTGAELIIEAITEDLASKQQLFALAESTASAEAVLASNTSAIDISAIASACADPARVLGTHWFNPPHIVPAVEVVPGDATSELVLERVCEGLRSVGRVPCRTRNTPGFVANRIQFAMVAEAFRCLEEGVADAETIDAIIRGSFGPRLAAFGVFEIADLAGLDVYASILDYLAQHLEQPAFAPAAVLREANAQGRFGVKAGSGMYAYGAPIDAILEARDRALYRAFARCPKAPAR